MSCGNLDREKLQEQGMIFVCVSKGNLTLTRFLTGKRAKLSPMKGLSSFKKLAPLRNDASAIPAQVADRAAPGDLGLDE